jgi:hypothetical protein
LSGAAYGELGVARAGMGVDCGDYDNDGAMDLVVTNFENEPNSLFRNLGNGMFQERSLASGIAKASLPSLSWGCKVVDFDLDGRRDLFWVSGHVNDYAVENKQSLGFNQPAQLLRNRGDGTFSEISHHCGDFFQRRQVARGAAFGDFDNDGDIDVLIGCNNQPALLLRKDTATTNRWLTLKLTGAGCNRDALGSKVTVRTDAMAQTDYVRSATSYLSDHDRRLHFGIGHAETATVEICWPCGVLQRFTAPSNCMTPVVEYGCCLQVEETQRPPRLSSQKPRG